MKQRSFRIVSIIATLLLLVPGSRAQSSRQEKDSLRQVIARTEGKERRGARNRLGQVYIDEVRKGGPLDSLLAFYDTLEAAV